jgi:hypothetical protein
MGITFIFTNFHSFGFAKYFDVRDSEDCIRGFYARGYEVGFARVLYNWFQVRFFG